MAAPVWQPGTVYIPGDIVQPVSGTPTAGSPIVNPEFSGSAAGWTLNSPWAFDGGSSFTSGSGSARFGTGFAGFATFLATAGIPVDPGRTITASCMCQQGASDAGMLALQVLIAWFDASDAPISSKLGSIVNSGSGGAWSQSTVTDTAPAGAAYVRIGAAGNRVGQNLPAWVDNFVWNYTDVGVPPGLVYKAVQPGAGTSGASEPNWPTVLGVQVVDNEVIWEAIAATRVTWEASPIFVSGATEPTWPTVVGESVADGSIKWTAISRRVEDVNCPNSKVVAIVASKVFAADGDIVRFCATADPLDWTSERNAGYLPTGLQQANANDMAVLNQYRSNLVAFNASSFQNWQADPDPEVMAILDQMDGVGSTWQQAARPVGNELFYLSQLGVRTVGIAGASTNLQAGDVGMPIDPLVQDAIKIAVANGAKALSTYYPSSGQYWLTFANYPPAELSVSGELPDGEVGIPYAPFEYVANGGVRPYTFSITSGELPPGLTMDAEGDVQGTPTAGGAYSWTVTVTDANGNQAHHPDTADITIVEWWMTNVDPPGQTNGLWVSDSLTAWAGAVHRTRGPVTVAPVNGVWGGGYHQLSDTQAAFINSVNIFETTNDLNASDNVVVQDITIPGANQLMKLINGGGGVLVVTSSGTSPRAYYTSGDAGQTWTQRPTPLSGTIPQTIARLDTGRWVMCCQTGSTRGYFYSDDAGEPINWTPGSGPAFDTQTGIALVCNGALAMTVNGPSTLKTTDGVTWSVTSNGLPNVAALCGDCDGDIFIFGDTNGTVLKRTTDAGITWSEVPFRNVRRISAYGNGLWVASCPGNGGGIFYSVDGGATWQEVSSYPPGVAPGFDVAMYVNRVRYVP